MSKERERLYYQKNKERILAARKKYYLKHKEERNEYQRAYYYSKNYLCKSFEKRLLTEDENMIVIKCVVLDKYKGTRERVLRVNSKTVEEAMKRIKNYYDVVSYEVLKKVPEGLELVDEYL